MIKHILHCACQAVAIQARCHSHIAQNVTDAVEVENNRLLSEVDEVTRARLVDIENTEVYEVIAGRTIVSVYPTSNLAILGTRSAEHLINLIQSKDTLTL